MCAADRPSNADGQLETIFCGQLGNEGLPPPELIEQVAEFLLLMNGRSVDWMVLTLKIVNPKLDHVLRSLALLVIDSRSSGLHRISGQSSH